MNAELTFLQFLQSLHSPMLDGSMGFITRLGDSGILWVTLTALLLVFRKRGGSAACWQRRSSSTLSSAIFFSSRWWPASVHATSSRRYSCLSRTRTISPSLRAIRRRPSPR